ncbi:NAD(P)-binding protein [Nakamurella sp. YIM 132087]|uniref:NAD(P)-binding protein n=1 Tax=Nakamurella alba TaxID=2665158 RepID=A0A7K1FKM8_9ACTN|nr:FAD-dependent oxidoreductase [Nakamurella alba]MTD13424.1 NAD(P)-binding protein [Nakamurella alba]
MTDTAVLFEPVRLGPLTLRNRLVMAPMGTCLDEDGYITDDTIAYYVRRAQGGVGSIAVEGCLVSADTVGPEPRLSDDRYLDGFVRLLAALAPYDVTVGVQLMHPGRQVVHGPVVAPSAVPLNSHAPVPHALTEDEIAVIISDFADAAERAVRAGFTFVEVHGAHGYLPSNFLSPTANVRTDGYGGDLAGRARFSREIARAITARVGPGVPLVWRINGADELPGGSGIEDAVQVSRWLESDGVSAISVSAGTWQSLQYTLAPMFMDRGYMVPYAAQVRAAVDIPVITVGRLDDPELAARAVTEGAADIVLLGRTLIAEPDWPEKVRTGRLDDLRPCIACNACVDLVGRGERARCSVNPEAGRERTWTMLPTPAPRRVMVVGSGPSGMEAARIARLRGHRVSLFERSGLLGGKLDVAGTAPSKREVLRFRDFQAAQMHRLGVDVHLDAPVDAAVVQQQDPDVVIVATGADPVVPPIPGISAAHVHDAQLVLREQVPIPAGSSVVVVGGSATGCETAESVVERGGTATIIEMRPTIGQGIEAITRRYLLKALRASGVRVLTSSKVVAIEADAVHYEDADGVLHAVPADLVALAIGWRPGGNLLADALTGDAREVLVLGDAHRPADFVSAINAGADAGLQV